MIINEIKKREFQVGVKGKGTSDFSLIKGDTMQQVEELEEELKRK
ncbi:hypothetical protein [Bacillus cereus]|nr:hypothetical protein [Bacillus cereus]